MPVNALWLITHAIPFIPSFNLLQGLLDVFFFNVLFAS